MSIAAPAIHKPDRGRYNWGTGQTHKNCKFKWVDGYFDRLWMHIIPDKLMFKTLSLLEGDESSMFITNASGTQQRLHDDGEVCLPFYDRNKANYTYLIFSAQCMRRALNFIDTCFTLC